MDVISPAQFKLLKHFKICGFVPAQTPFVLMFSAWPVEGVATSGFGPLGAQEREQNLDFQMRGNDQH